jgi:hypothetical protein
VQVPLVCKPEWGVNEKVDLVIHTVPSVSVSFLGRIRRTGWQLGRSSPLTPTLKLALRRVSQPQLEKT